MIAAVARTRKKDPTLADLIRDLGDVSPRRVRLQPPPGRAKVDDLIRINCRQDRIYELVNGTLVEKAMEASEALVAFEVMMIMGAFVKPRRLGFILPPDATLRIMPRLVRAPDISFIRRAKFRGGKFPRTPVPELVPDLAIEILSKSNRPGEIKRKLKEYFEAGVTAVWVIDPDTEMAKVYSAPNQFVEVNKDQAVDGGKLLPGFRLPLAELFADLEEKPARVKRNGKRKMS